MPDKAISLLRFLKAAAIIRRKRISSYGSADKILWLADVPSEYAECRSPFLTINPEDSGDLWLEVRKKRMPARPPVPEVVKDWVRVDELDQAETEPELLPKITVIVEREVPDPDATEGAQRTIVQKVPELRRLADHPEVEEAWIEYIVEKWGPWAQEMRRWQEVQSIYESLDFMRRRLEEAEERYELVLAIGFLQWHDPTGTAVARHVLTAPAEITLDATKGLLTVTPAASFDGFRIELDMLEPQHWPQLDKNMLDGQLEELDIRAWDTSKVVTILCEIGNRLRADVQVEETFQRAERVEEHPHLSFAPAIVLRERRPTAYEYDCATSFL